MAHSDVLTAEQKTLIKNLIDLRVRKAVNTEKTYQLAVIRRNEMYYRGFQNLFPRESAGITDWNTATGGMRIKTPTGEEYQVEEDYVINEYRGVVRKLVGVLGHKSPNVKARPDWVDDETAAEAVPVFDEIANFLRPAWRVEYTNRHLVKVLATQSTAFMYTQWVADKERYGEHVEPTYADTEITLQPGQYDCPNCGMAEPEMQDTPPPESCPGCGWPMNYSPPITAPDKVKTGETRYPRGSVELQLASGLTVTTPFYVQDLTHCPWLWYEYQEDIGRLMEMYSDPEIAKYIDSNYSGTEGSQVSQQAMFVRQQVASPAAGSSTEGNKGTYAQFWLAPSMYNYLRGSNAAADHKELHDLLRTQYPNGVRIVMVNDSVVRLYHERLSDHWVACKPETSEFIWADPLMNDFIDSQDIINAGWTILFRLLTRIAPDVFFDPQVIDADMMRSRPPLPGNYIPAIEGQGANLEKAMWKGPAMDLKPEAVQLIEAVKRAGEELLGLFPSVYGGEAPVQTAEQARRQLNQALMVLATTWNEMRDAWSKAYRNAAKLIGKYSMGVLVMSDSTAETASAKEVPNVELLAKGGVHYECDQGVPMSWTQLNDFVKGLYQASPEYAMAMGASDPANLDLIAQGNGVPGWTVRGIKIRRRVLDKIGQLLEQQPIDGGMGPMGPLGPMPSEEADPFIYPPEIVVPVVQDWLMDKEAKRLEGSPGYQNVVLWGKSSAAAGMAAMQPQPGEPGGPPPGDQPAPEQGALPPAAEEPANDQLGQIPEQIPQESTPTANVT